MVGAVKPPKGHRATRKGIPLALLIARYFAYVVLVLGLVWLGSFAVLSLLFNRGVVYPANYGPSHSQEVAGKLRDVSEFSPQAVPTPYRYVLVAAGGEVLQTDMSQEDVGSAVAALEDALGSGLEDGRAKDSVAVAAGSGVTYTSFLLSDGTACVLQSSYLPHFVSRSLDSHLPNPQNLMLVSGCALSVVAIALVARRAGTVIARKFQPLVAAAERIACQDLSFHVAGSNVRQIDQVLSAMESMRSSLEESLEARWRAERMQKDQIASLAHDIKTPLTVVLANAEYVQGEAQCPSQGPPQCADGQVAGDTSVELGEIGRACGDIAQAARRLDAYVKVLSDVSLGQVAQVQKETVPVRGLVDQVGRDASALACSAGKEAVCRVSTEAENLAVLADEQVLARAVMNLVANAVRFAESRVSVSFQIEDGFLCIRVEDDGAGFAQEALRHGCERFYQGDASRSDGHIGLGLYTASQVAKAHGGSLVLRNLCDRGGSATGACAELRVLVVGQ